MIKPFSTRLALLSAGLAAVSLAAVANGSSNSTGLALVQMSPAARAPTLKEFFEKGPGALRSDGTANVPVGFSSAAQSASASPRLAVRLDPVPGYSGLYNGTMTNTQSGLAELFLLQVPASAPTQPVPLLVVFHKFGVSHADVLYHTDFCKLAKQRGWYLVAPLGASQNNFDSLESQLNTQQVLDWTLTACRVDRQRIYGVGFSMGGGCVTSYTARHLDPARAMFAAIVDHTGGVALRDTYANESPAVTQILQAWYGLPTTNMFAYQRCSTIDLDPLNGQIGSGTDMSRNLAHVPVMTWLANADPNLYLPAQTQAFFSHIQALNAKNTLVTVNANVHDWSTLDDNTACNWLAQQTLVQPTSASTLADQGGTWFRYQVVQDASGAFTPFHWYVDAIANRLNLWGTANLKRLVVDGTSLGLSYVGSLKLNMSAADGSGDEVQFTNVPHAPLMVLRDGIGAAGVYDALAHTFLVQEASATGHQWVLVF